MNSILQEVANFINNAYHSYVSEEMDLDAMPPAPLTLLPTLNQQYVEEMRDQLQNEPDQTVRLAATRPLYRFYFCKLGNQIYQVIQSQGRYNVSSV